MNDVLTNAESVLTTLGPYAGAIVILRLLWSYQQTVLEGALKRTSLTDERLDRAEARIDELEREVADCEDRSRRHEMRNAQLERAMTLSGIDIPPPTTGA